MKQFLYSFLMLFFVGLTACQQKEESPVTENQITERHSCCDTTKMDSIYYGGVVKGITLPYVTARNDWYYQPCEEECFDFNHDLGTCDDNAIVNCLNEDVNNCEEKTALSSWICLGTPPCFEVYCNSSYNLSTDQMNFLYYGNIPNSCSGGAIAFFEIDPTQFCQTMDCVSQMGINYLFENRNLYQCNNNTRPIIEYQLVAKTSGILECQCFPGWEVYQGYNAELWIKIWCCED